jgi:CRISPR-associated exonuclease Cas4
MYTEEDLLPLSALQHLLFCERRAALVHIEGVWEENVFTVEGAHVHQRVEDDLPVESRGDIRIARGLRLRSLRLGLAGKADVVEFHRMSEEGAEPSTRTADGFPSVGVALPGATGLWRPFPVEYKRGRLRREEGYEVQLCAQAICLEEMLGVGVPEGAIFYGKPRRRLEVAIDASLRNRTELAVERLHELLNAGVTPQARYEKKCDSCSLVKICLPKAMSTRRGARGYLAQALMALEKEGEGS